MQWNTMSKFIDFLSAWKRQGEVQPDKQFDTHHTNYSEPDRPRRRTDLLRCSSSFIFILKRPPITIGKPGFIDDNIHLRKSRQAIARFHLCEPSSYYLLLILCSNVQV